MLELFRRPGDPDPASRLYALPLVAALGAYGLALRLGAPPAVHALAGLASALCCVGALAGLASLQTARAGNALGVVGVALGTASVIGSSAAAAAAGGVAAAATAQLLAQQAAALALGGAAGLAVARRCAITDLPQLVAAFHSLVGLAAAATGVASFAAHPGTSPAAVWAGTLIGGATFTGSVVAFLKLSGGLPSKPLALPFKGLVNAALLAGCAAAVPAVLSGSLAHGLAALAAVAALSMLLGGLATAAIGSADVPVVITVLNSASGWALCAEGFVLSSELLTIVGALIGAWGV